MEMLYEIILDLVVGLVTDFGGEVMRDSEVTRKWPRPVKNLLVIVTLIIYWGVILILLFWGINFLIKGNFLLGVFLSGIGMLFLVLFIVELRRAYIRRRGH